MQHFFCLSLKKESHYEESYYKKQSTVTYSMAGRLNEA